MRVKKARITGEKLKKPHIWKMACRGKFQVKYKAENLAKKGLKRF